MNLICGSNLTSDVWHESDVWHKSDVRHECQSKRKREKEREREREREKRERERESSRVVVSISVVVLRKAFCVETGIECKKHALVSRLLLVEHVGFQQALRLHFADG